MITPSDIDSSVNLLGHDTSSFYKIHYSLLMIFAILGISFFSSVRRTPSGEIPFDISRENYFGAW